MSFQIFGSKSRRISGTKEVCQRFFENSKKLLVFEFWWVVLIFDYAPTSSLRGPATQHLNPRPKAEFDGTGGRMGRMGRMGRVGRVGRSSKVSFKFLQTLWVFRTYIYTCIRNKNCHQHSYGFQNLMSSWGWGNTNLEITIFT